MLEWVEEEGGDFGVGKHGGGAVRELRERSGLGSDRKRLRKLRK